MQLTMSGEYAVRAMMHLAGLPAGTAVPLKTIAAAWEIPETFLRKIAAQLSRGGLLVSTRGNGGGVSLARPAESLTVLDIIEVVEGEMSLNKCLMSPAECGHSTTCAVHVLWCEAQGRLKETLRSRSLADLAAQTARRRARVAATR
jgi:Rrf2 family transcriptional regulator, iron-sulfur cluster assembly transcription factor